MNLGENIHRLRTEKNMSQGDLADALDVSRQSVSKWENGSAVPELEKLIKMSDLFGVTLDELTGRETTQSKRKIEVAPRPVTVRKIIGALLLCAAVVILILFSIRASLGVTAGLYFGLALGSAGTALCWPQCPKAQLCFGVADTLFLFALMLLQQDTASALVLSIPFLVIYGIWGFLTQKA